MQVSDSRSTEHWQTTRRHVVLVPWLASVATALLPASQAVAFQLPPTGYRRHEDKLDGYAFVYPDDWFPVTTSGNDVFYRNPFSVDQCVFVNLSSPSSSKYSSVEDLGTPDAAAQRVLKQYLEELMSTRLGVAREAQVLSATSRSGQGGKLYYDIQVRVKSYASRNQLAVTQREIDEGRELEWDRQFLTVLGVANKRLYELRLQSTAEDFQKNLAKYETMADSFQTKEVEA